MSNIVPKLYVKSGCPWCHAAIEFLDNHNISYHELNVSEDSSSYDEMVRLSGQSKAPTMDWNGEILADFGVEELEPFLKERQAL